MSTWSGLLAELLAGRSLSAEQTRWAMGEIMDGAASDAQIAAFVVALRAKGETSAEVDGFVARCSTTQCGCRCPRSWPPGRSTPAAPAATGRTRSTSRRWRRLVVAGAGVPVVKHGNRAATSQTGSADLLEALGVAIDLTPAGVARCVEQAGIGFCFAPLFHPALRHAAGTRGQLGHPDDLQRPRPADQSRHSPVARRSGVPQPLAPVMAQVLARARHVSAGLPRRRRARRADPGARRRCGWCGRSGDARRSSTPPIWASHARSWRTCAAGTPRHNAEVAREVLAGERGPVRDAVALNAAAAIAGRPGQRREPATSGSAERWRVAREALATAALLTR